MKKWWFSIVMLNYQRLIWGMVTVLHQSSIPMATARSTCWPVHRVHRTRAAHQRSFGTTPGPFLPKTTFWTVATPNKIEKLIKVIYSYIFRKIQWDIFHFSVFFWVFLSGLGNPDVNFIQLIGNLRVDPAPSPQSPPGTPRESSAKMKRQRGAMAWKNGTT